MNISVSEGGFTGTWIAVDDDTYDGAPDSHCPLGWGFSKRAAVEALRESYELHEDDDGIMACDIWLRAQED